MAQGVVVRFDDVKGYGFIAPDNGGEDVFVHVNDLAEPGTTLTSGTRVVFDVLDGGRGLKAYDVSLAGPAQATGGRGSNGGATLPPGGGPLPSGALDTSAAPAASVERGAGSVPDDTCAVFSRGEFTQLVTELLLTSGPDLTARQVVELRSTLAGFAAEHGWVVD
ncbi:DNA-binding protein [Streptomyces viridochromogenes DSM 40736]|uniref:DNA-binding protein n=1 Tax=Streptomyces viridochromogenes (strain DSM 40736 / JCM 4977 / BCRC 1201 / Tue 494) TaxID=591159 RepID=D9XDN8_STRVT|nr:cold shock domain-containing protein [Streptomyces viridochromogenes]EFL30417.1 DNA-binding protein [Streptomyces viridochromogenes DSM 40736]